MNMKGIKACKRVKSKAQGGSTNEVGAYGANVELVTEAES